MNTHRTLIDNTLWKNQNGFRRNRSTASQILTIRRILEGVRAKNVQVTIQFVDFTKAFDSIHRWKMEQILQAYCKPKETVAAITILYRNTKVKVRSPDGDTDYYWKQHPTKPQMYAQLPPITKTIQARLTRHAGHGWRSRDKLIMDVLLWTPHKAEQMQDDQLEPTYSISVKIRDVVLKNYQKWWTKGGEAREGQGYPC